MKKTIEKYYQKEFSNTLKTITYPECVCQEMQGRSSVWKYIINIIHHIKRKKTQVKQEKSNIEKKNVTK